MKENWIFNPGIDGGVVVRRAIEVAVTDALLLVGTYLVIVNRQWKINCALGLTTDCTPRNSPHFAYSVFTVYFSMNSSLTPHVLLTSPPSLDWVQVFVAALVVINAWYLITHLRERSKGSALVQQVPQA